MLPCSKHFKTLFGINSIMHIREASIQDLDGVFPLAMHIVRQHQAYNFTRFVHLPNHEQQVRGSLCDAIASPQATVLVVEHEGAIVGFAFIKMEATSLENIAAESAWLHDIYLESEVRGGGWGKRLLDACSEAAQKLGSPNLMLHVAPQNTFAQELFRACGFEATMIEMMLVLGNTPIKNAS